jgi:hypothetical protein
MVGQLGQGRAAMVRFELHKHALIEERGDVTTIYGRWDRIFGCWRDAPATGPVAYQPRRPILSAVGPGSARPHQSWDWGQAPAVGEFLALIPSRVRDLAAPFADQQWLLLEAMWRIPEFIKFTHGELLFIGPGFIGMALVLGRCASLPLQDRLALYRAIMGEKRAALLGRLAPGADGKLLVKMASRANWATASEEELQCLISCLTQPNKRRLLLSVRIGHTDRHLGLPGQGGLLRRLDRFPDWAVTANWLSLAEHTSSIMALGRMVEALTEEWPGERIRFRDFVTRRGTKPPTRSWLWGLTRRVCKLQFPPPPFPGSDLLRPITSPSELTNEARLMQNCVAGNVGPIIDRWSYFYHWNGWTEATVMVVPTVMGERWHVAEAKGKNNQNLEVLDAIDIRAEVQALQVRHRPSIGQSDEDGDRQSRRRCHDLMLRLGNVTSRWTESVHFLTEVEADEMEFVAENQQIWDYDCFCDECRK